MLQKFAHSAKTRRDRHTSTALTEGSGAFGRTLATRRGSSDLSTFASLLRIRPRSFSKCVQKRLIHIAMVLQQF